jgi:DNA end-binding protein Ku
LPKRPSITPAADELEKTAAPVRPLWSGTITFGLVSIPVELLSAIRPRQTALKLVDKHGRALGRQFRCSKEDKKLDNDDLVRGYETDSGEIVEITDQEFEAVAPEMSSDIELRSFVPLEQIPPIYFQKPYFLAPAGKSAKAYHLLTATMARTRRVGIGSFVMRGHEYLVAIVPDNGVLRADTLRYADELRSPESMGLPKRKRAAAKRVAQFSKEIDALTRNELDVAELRDQEAAALQRLVAARQEDRGNVVHPQGMEEAEADTAAGAQVIDLMAVLRRSLAKTAVVHNAEAAAPISLAERRARRASTSSAVKPTKKSAKKKVSRSHKAVRNATRKRAP